MLYTVRLDAGDVARGEQVICEVMRWVGQDDAFAYVRILHSTLAHARYRTGQTGVMPRERLRPWHALLRVD